MTNAFPVPIEAGHVVQFARAIGDFGAMLDREVDPPPTFCMVADQFDPRFARRPRPDLPWPNSEQIPMAGSPGGGDVPLHAAQRFDYHRPIVVGEVLSAAHEPPKEWVKQGRRGGRLRFVELVTNLSDAAGAPVVRMSWLDVYTERTHRAVSTSAPAATAPASASDASAFDASAFDVEVLELSSGLTRTQMVMYVGAVGDFHPLHHDEQFAHDHGYPSVFAPGMLTMALAGRAVTTHLAAASLEHFEGRFHGQVWPGDAIIARLSDRTDSSVRVELVDGTGRLLFSGTAGGRRA